MDTRQWPAAVSDQAAAPNGSAVSKATQHPVAFVVAFGGLAGIPFGLIAMLWLSDWRWAVTGLLVAAAMLIISVVLNVVLGDAYRK